MNTRHLSVRYAAVYHFLIHLIPWDSVFIAEVLTPLVTGAFVDVQFLERITIGVNILNVESTDQIMCLASGSFADSSDWSETVHGFTGYLAKKMYPVCDNPHRSQVGRP